jgi:phosphate starvation-inducible protein PhoH and related proteins
MKRKARENKQEAESPLRNFHIQPKNKNQQRLLKAIDDHPIVVTLGAAGVGKTYCAASKVAQLFTTGRYENIILTRSNVPTGRSLGYFPGDINEKLTPWLMPMISVLKQQFGFKYDYLANKGSIQLQPLETIRGRSFQDSLILVDECQNLTIDEIKAITTRLGENSKMILMGDATQSDIDKGSNIIKFCSICERNNIEIPIIKFTVDDIVRSDIVGSLVRMFIKENI